MNKNRNSSLELLRILAGVGIVLGHAQSKGNALLFTNGMNLFWANFFAPLANIGSDVLALLGFYFMIDQTFKSKNWIKLWLKVIYYYSTVTIFIVIFAGYSVNSNIIKMMFPIYGRPYWFTTAYLVFMLLSPFLNSILSKASDAVLKKYILMSCCLFVVMPSLNASASVLEGDYVLFLTMYVGIYFIKKRTDFCKQLSVKKASIMVAVTFLFIVVGGYLLPRVFYKLSINLNFSFQEIISGAQSMLVLLVALLLLIIFLSIKDFKSSVVNCISGATLGVYLFHCHPLIKNDLFWAVIHYSEYYDSVAFVPYTLFIPLCVYGIVMVMEIPFNTFFRWFVERKIVTEKLTRVDNWFKIE